MADNIFTLFTLIKELLLTRDFKIPVNTYIQVETIHTMTSIDYTGTETQYYMQSESFDSIVLSVPKIGYYISRSTVPDMS